MTAKKQEEHEILKSKKNGEEVEQSLVVSITIRERKTILQVVHVGCEEARMWRALHGLKLVSLQSPQPSVLG